MRAKGYSREYLRSEYYYMRKNVHQILIDNHPRYLSSKEILKRLPKSQQRVFSVWSIAAALNNLSHQRKVSWKMEKDKKIWRARI